MSCNNVQRIVHRSIPPTTVHFSRPRMELHLLFPVTLQHRDKSLKILPYGKLAAV